ncbi:MAG: RraA family protein [Solirubrobacteraceae bacterium]
MSADTGLAQRLAALGSCGISDAQDGRGLISSGLVRLSGAGAIAGRAITAACEDGSAGGALFAMAEAQPGDVLCVVCPGETASMGDLVMDEIRRRGIAGLVVDGFMRDTAALQQMGFSCWARGVTPVRSGHRSPGQPNVPIEMGPTTVQPGNWIVGDDDGVMALPVADLDGVLERGDAQIAFEARVRELMAGGASLIEAFTAAGGH